MSLTVVVHPLEGLCHCYTILLQTRGGWLHSNHPAFRADTRFHARTHRSPTTSSSTLKVGLQAGVLEAIARHLGVRSMNGKVGKLSPVWGNIDKVFATGRELSRVGALLQCIAQGWDGQMQKGRQNFQMSLWTVDHPRESPVPRP